MRVLIFSALLFLVYLSTTVFIVPFKVEKPREVKLESEIIVWSFESRFCSRLMLYNATEGRLSIECRSDPETDPERDLDLFLC